jgi:hypothetical protein
MHKIWSGSQEMKRALTKQEDKKHIMRLQQTEGTLEMLENLI